MFPQPTGKVSASNLKVKWNIFIFFFQPYFFCLITALVSAPVSVILNYLLFLYPELLFPTSVRLSAHLVSVTGMTGLPFTQKLHEADSDPLPWSVVSLWTPVVHYLNLTSGINDIGFILQFSFCALDFNFAQFLSARMLCWHLAHNLQVYWYIYIYIYILYVSIFIIF